MTKEAIHPLWNLCEFLERTLGRLPTLQSLDLRMETSFYLHKWPFEMIYVDVYVIKIFYLEWNLYIHLPILNH